MAVAVEPFRDGPARRTRTAWIATALALGWFAVVAAVYYRQLWWLLAAGPDAWSIPDLGQSLRHDGLPFVRQAATSAVRAIGAAGAIVVAFVAAGRLADRWLTPPSLTATERLVVRFANGAGAWSFGCLALAGLSLYRPLVLRIAIFSTLAGATAWTLYRGRAVPGGTAGERDASATPVRSGRGGGPLIERVWQAITLAAAAVALVCALAPEIEYDALWYHLELPRRWLAAGHPVDDVTEYIALYPLTWQLLFGAALALDGAQAASLLHWTTFLMSAIVAASIGRRALGVTSAWFVAATFVTAPTVLWEATTAYVDLATALHAGLGIGALSMVVRERDRRWLWLAGIQCGLACATKHLALVPVGIALILFAVSRIHASGWRAATRRLVVPVVMTLLLPSPWYIRAWRGSGNPFFPEMHQVFGATPDRWDALTEQGLGRFKSRFGGQRDAVRLLALPWDMTMHGARYGGTLGPLLLMLGPFIVLAWRRSVAARWLTGWAVLYLAVWASPVSSFQLRFLVPFWVLAAPLFTLTARSLVDSSTPAGRQMITVIVAVVLATNLPPFLPLHEGDRSGWTGWLTHVVRRVPVEVVVGGVTPDAYLTRELRTFGAWTFLDAHTPADIRVLTFFGGDHFYARRARLWSEAVAARPVTWGATDVPVSTLLDRLRQLGITHVMAPAPDRRTPEQSALSILQPATRDAAFDVIYEDYWTVVYRVRAAGSAAGVTDQRNGS